MNTLGGAFASFLFFGSIIYAATGFIMKQVFQGKITKAWVPQFTMLVLSLLAAFLFQLNILPVAAPYMGGHIANLPLWAAEVLTGIAIAAISDGAVSGFQATLAAISKQPQPVSAKKLWS